MRIRCRTVPTGAVVSLISEHSKSSKFTVSYSGLWLKTKIILSSKRKIQFTNLSNENQSAILVDTLRKRNELLEKTVINLSIQLSTQLDTQVKSNDVLFSDFIITWLEHHKKDIKPTTYDGYKLDIQKHIIPYLIDRKITLNQLTPKTLQDFYDFKTQSLSSKSVCHLHSYIHSSLRYACITEMIKYNPSENVELPKIKDFKPSFYSPMEINLLLSNLRKDNSQIYTPVLLASYLGLRRSEILGLKWSNINFKNKTILISRTVVRYISTSDVLISETTKNKSSRRTLPMSQFLYEYLYSLKQINDILYTNSPDKDFVCLRSNGDLIKPDYLSATFKNYIKSNNFRYIRLHDLRHSCASLLISQGISLKQIQDWLGHSTIQSTLIYTH